MDVPKDSIYSGPKVRKISLIEYTVKSFHEVVYNFISIFDSLLGEMEIDHSCFQLAVPHVTLNESGIGSGFR